MPSYRTTSLFHYTKTSDNLFDILSSGKLIPNYCKEDLSNRANPDFILGIPMVCFCDIPILSAEKFLINYGHYSIAFEKDWGLGNGCNPIFYVNNRMILLSYYQLIIKDISWIKDIAKELDSEKSKYSPYFKHIYALRMMLRPYSLGFLKKYESEWKGEPYNNYDENEWRYIVEDSNPTKWLNKDEYEKWRGDVNSPKPEPTEALIEKSLSFSPSDIHHIILYEESEIPPFIRRIRKLEKIGDTVLDADTKDILISKISSFERIKEDY